MRCELNGCCLFYGTILRVIVASDPWDSGKTLPFLCLLTVESIFAKGYMVQATNWITASVPTLLSEEVTSIHPITLLTQVRQLRKIENTPGFSL